MEKKQKIKQWFADHKEEIKKEAVNFVKVYGLILTGGLIGCHCMAKAKDRAYVNGLANLHQKGYIKFFDPSTSQEVDAWEMCDVFNRDKVK